jgi:HEAT repeat protein
LQAALHIERPATGTWGYPGEKCRLAIEHFGSNRAAAFPILKKAASDSNPEVRRQAVSAMRLVGVTARPNSGWRGEASPEAAPFLWPILNGNDSELSYLALSSLRTIGFQPKDIPALADLLVQTHNNFTVAQRDIAHANISRVPNLLERISGNESLQRYLPEAIAETIRQNPDTVAPFISSVENLLDVENADIRFGAACALAKYKGVNDSKISKELTAGLKGPDGLKQLMAIETLQHIGTDAQPMIPEMLEYANSIDDRFIRELAFRAIGYIDSNLRNTMPEVDQALKNDPSLKNVVEKVK